MRRSSGYRPVVWLRRFLLVVLVGFLGVVTGLLVKGRQATPEADRKTAQKTPLSGSQGDQLRTGKGFGHEVTEQGETRYRISATSWSASREELVNLDDVDMTVNRGDGNEYTIRADSGVYQKETSTARLDGNVSIRSSQGLEVRGPGFELTRQGQLIVSTGGPVTFRYQDRFAGSAREVTSNLRRKRNELSGAVSIWSLAGAAMDASLTARRLVFEEENQQIHAEGGVTLRRDGEELQARRLSVTLDDAGKNPRFVRAKWEVTGSRAQVEEGVPRILRFRANELSLLFEEGRSTLQKAELEGTAGAPATLESESAGDPVRQLSTPYLVAEFTAGEIARAEALGPVGLRDFLAFAAGDPLLTGCGDSAVARFKRGGELSELVLEGGVQFHRPEAQVTGQTLEAKGQGQVVVNGTPARIYARRGEFEAPQILYRPEKGSGRASGGVRATLTRRSGVDLLAREEDAAEPVRVTAEVAEWSGDTGEVVFKRAVRAWQAENFLVAQEMTLGEAGGTLTATGQVKTVIRGRRGAGDEGSEPRKSLEVSAGKLEFDRDTGTARYTGLPKAHQAGRSLSCTDLEVLLGESSEVEQMLCSGNALIENPQGGQTVRGREALYRPETESVLVTGSPVVLRNANGTQVTGARVIYDFKTGAARVLTDDPTRAETVEETAGEGGREEGDR